MTMTDIPQTMMTATAHTPARMQPTFVRWAEYHGKVFAEPTSVVDALVASRLDFTVSKEELLVVTSNGAELDFPSKVATVRNNGDGTRNVLGIVGSNYSVCQNAEAFAWAQDLVDDYDANIVAAASYGRVLGSSVYLALRSPDTITVGDDVHDLYVSLNNSHDGSSGLNVRVTAVRPHAGTEVAVDLRRAHQSWSVRHSGDLALKAREAATTMANLRAWAREYEDVSYQLLATPMGAEQFTAFAKAFLPTPNAASEKAAEKWAMKRLELRELFEVSDHAAFGRGTFIAAFNAACAWVDERYATRGKNSPQLARAERAVDGRSAAAKQRAWSLLRSML